jgi:hypothetical protein
MAFLRRRVPLHQRLAEAGGLGGALRAAAPAAQPPGWYGEQGGEPGIHGIPRARRWDVVVSARLGDVGVERLGFVALPDGSLVIDDPGEGEALPSAAASTAAADAAAGAAPASATSARFAGDLPPDHDAAVTALAEAVEASLPPPYRAEAVRRGDGAWAVGASRIAVVEAQGLHGDEAELVSTREGRSLRVDGQARFGSVPAFEAAGEAEGGEYVVRGRRLEGHLWEIEATPL